MREFQFLQTPGPTNVPGRVLEALARPTIDHRGREFANLAKRIFPSLQRLLRTNQPVVVFPSSGTGAWEAALVNTLSPGDAILMYETGHFATLWRNMADRLGLDVIFLQGDWRSGVDVSEIYRLLDADRDHRIKAVCCVHSETSTGTVSSIADIRLAMDEAQHAALLIVDAISSLGALDYRHDEWRVDVTVSASQKGLMLPPGLGINALSEKALIAAESAKMPRSYWDWGSMLTSNTTGLFPYTPATNLLFGLAEALQMIEEEGLENVLARHKRLAEATRRTVSAWGLDILCSKPDERSNSLTTVVMPEGYNADEFRSLVSSELNLILGGGLGRLGGKVFRIGHLGRLNELMLCGVLSGVAIGLRRMSVPLRCTGIDEALRYLDDSLAHAGEYGDCSTGERQTSVDRTSSQ